MVNPLQRPALVPVAVLCVAFGLLAACVGSGAGLDANGNPIAADSSSPTVLSADFQSIQDNVFTPICTRCHSGANAPEGLQLDQAHSYALLVGVPSAEVPSILRVDPGDPTDSYLIQKLRGSSGIVGAQMPFGGPYLPQSTIDVIQQWITNGAPSASSQTDATLAVTATTPVDHSAVDSSVATIAIGFSRQPQNSLLNAALRLQHLSPVPGDIPLVVTQAVGNPSTVLLTPLAPLGPGAYQITVHGGEGNALSSVDGAVLPADYSFTFTVEAP
jgi:methionine-rich copper-binding protein CopC